MRLAKECQRLLRRLAAVQRPDRGVDGVRRLIRTGYAHRRAPVLALEQPEQRQLPRGDMHEVILHRPTVSAGHAQTTRTERIDQGVELVPSPLDRRDDVVGHAHAPAAIRFASSTTAS